MTKRLLIFAPMLTALTLALATTAPSSSFAAREAVLVHSTFDRSSSALVGAKLEPLTRAVLVTVGSTLKSHDSLVIAALCAFLEPVYDGTAPRRLAAYVPFLPPLLSPCAAKTTSFFAWASDLEAALKRQSQVVAVLVSDGQLGDDPRRSQLSAVVQRLAQQKNLVRLYVFGLRADNDSTRSAAAFQRALAGLRPKLVIATNTAWSEQLRQLQEELR